MNTLLYLLRDGMQYCVYSLGSLTLLGMSSLEPQKLVKMPHKQAAFSPESHVGHGQPASDGLAKMNTYNTAFLFIVK